jgi:general secretion pathway protein A
MWFSLLRRLPPWLFIVLALGSVAALAASTLSTRAERHRQALLAAQRSASRVVQSVARDQERLIESASQLVMGLAQRAEIQTHDASECSTLFAGILKRFPQYLDLAAIGPSGEIVCGGRSPEAAAALVGPVETRPSFETGDIVLGPYTIDRASGKAMIPLFAPSVDETGVVRTIVAAGLDLTSLARTLIETPLGGASLVIVDRQGMILTHHPRPETWVGKRLDEPIKTAILAQGEGMIEGLGLDGLPGLFVFAPLLRDPERAGDATVIIALPRTIVFGEADRLFTMQVVGLGLFGFSLVVAAGIGIDRLARWRERGGRPALRRRGADPTTHAIRPVPGPDARVAATTADTALAVERSETPAVAPVARSSGVVPVPRDTAVEAYWGLAEAPFENSPNPKFLYPSPEHEEAIARLVYAVTHRRGAAMLTGEYGCGKTTVARALLQQLAPDRYEIGLVVNPCWTATDFLRELLYQMGVETPETGKFELLHLLNDLFYKNYRAGRDTVVVVDEGQLITDDAIFEELRLLLNFQLAERFLVTLVLIGSPELRERVRRLPHLNQRITIRCHLNRLSYEHTASYIAHRVRLAGQPRPLFTEDAVKLIYTLTRGTPREINNRCDLSLLVGHARQLREIDQGVIRQIMSEALSSPA